MSDTASETRRGWRLFTCSDCGNAWKLATRDRTSPSGEDCPQCGEWTFPDLSYADDLLPVDRLGNLIFNGERPTPQAFKQVSHPLYYDELSYHDLVSYLAWRRSSPAVKSFVCMADVDQEFPGLARVWRLLASRVIELGHVIEIEQS